MGALFAPFTKVAANPHTSAPVERSTGKLVTPTEANRPIADPYIRYILIREKVNQGAAVLLMSREKADQLGLRARAKIVDQTTVGVDPVIMLTGPIPATEKILERNGMKIDDIDLIEINEAFASVVAAWRRELEPDMDRVNVNGGAIALGHPLGMSGARLVTTATYQLQRNKQKLALCTMCIGVGQGIAILIERV